MNVEGLQLGSFALSRTVARGGFGEIWLAEHPRSERKFAAKTLRQLLGSTSENRLAFAREADAVARLSHPGIISIYDIGQVDDAAALASGKRLASGTPYLVMDFLPRGPIRESQAQPWIAVERVLRDVLAALAHAHARSVLHLDLKPSNVLRRVDTNGVERYVITDFGTATRMDRDSAERAVRGYTEGTPLFMAPERFVGRDRDQGPWTDLYSLGVMTWLLLAGSPPFDASDLKQLAEAHARNASRRYPPSLTHRTALRTGL